MPNEQNPVQPNYQAMADINKERPAVEGAASATQAQLMEMSAGERWAHEQAQGVERVGGNEGHFTQGAGGKSTEMAGGQTDFTLAEAGTSVTNNAELPARTQQGITQKYEVTDRDLDFDGEEGYPTPT